LQITRYVTIGVKKTMRLREIIKVITMPILVLIMVVIDVVEKIIND